ncbi:MAG: trypsin-like serine protease [Dysgonamonadaceae bacterium]|jgi:hypothetical protein|nr:trypsin-like serine protease [Dysgonamonadaceae bacterium]
MKTNKTISAIILGIFVLMMSCTSIIDQGMEVMVEEEVYTSRFHVHYVDNCGYLLLEDIEGLNNAGFYKPVNLPEEYKQEGLRVDVTFRYRLLRSETCNCSERSIEIEGIMETPEAQTRVTGGDTINISKVPWQAAVLLLGSQTCGGVIIAPNFILTAKHCIRNNGQLYPPSIVRVRVGVTCRQDPNSSMFDVVRIIPHPDPDVDVALLQLSSNIPFDNTKQPIDLPSSSSYNNVGTRVNISGWGRTQQGQGMPTAQCLHAVDLHIISNDAGGNALWIDLFDHEIAATGTGSIRQGGCHGDSGGPLTTLSTSGKPVLIGITSFGRTDCVGTNQNSPSIFTRVSSIVDWIVPHIEEGVVINGTRWATRNVDMPGTFAANPQNYGRFYQYGTRLGVTQHWPNSGAVISAAWWSWVDRAAWAVSNHPCPAGWQLPSEQEFRDLGAGTWHANWNGTGVAGLTFGTEPNALFLPAAGWCCDWRDALVPAGTGGSYWSRTHVPGSRDPVDQIHFDVGKYGASLSDSNRAFGLSLRCVAR